MCAPNFPALHSLLLSILYLAQSQHAILSADLEPEARSSCSAEKKSRDCAGLGFNTRKKVQTLLDQSHASSSSSSLPLSLVHLSSSFFSSFFFGPTPPPSMFCRSLLPPLCLSLSLSLCAPLIRFGSTPRSEKNIGGTGWF
ncbi:hypothetical protein AMECASPLE_001790 [Ameca splendens]|uniref:Secreted protein n=1 Tax=Ameca splendens TaxID=208324 RepID=A0ABV0Z7H1_9TELE